MASPCGAVIDVFQSTPSVGRATGQCIKPHLRQSISIHALRGEGDLRYTGFIGASIKFQSTPTVGRATHTGVGGF